MVRLQPANECVCTTCVGHVAAPEGTFGGMICQCGCHKKETPDPSKPQPLGFEREAREITRRVDQILHIGGLTEEGWAEFQEDITLALEAAYREGRRSANETIFSEGETAGFCQAWNACREEAAKVAEEEQKLYEENSTKCGKCRNYVGEAADLHSAMACKTVATRIRALKPAEGYV